MKFGIGQAVARVEDRRFVTGHGRYTDDHDLQGQARAYFLRSPHAHARIARIDASAARKAPGVVAVFVASDVRALGGLPCAALSMLPLKRPDGSPAFGPRHDVMQGECVRTVGDIVAMVVAQTLVAARDAAERIEVDYEELPAVTEVKAAIRPGAPAIWREAPDNICFAHRLGDHAAVERAFAGAAHRVRYEWRNNRVAPVSMEPRAALASYDPFEDRITLIAGVQGPYRTRAPLARDVLRVPDQALRLISPDMGGGFGMRSQPYAEQALVAWAAKTLRRPVKWAADRGEAFLSDDQARDSVMQVELALNADGIFLALRVTGWTAMGAYLSNMGPWPAFGNIGGIAGVYRTPAIAVTSHGVFTNAPPTAPYRGAGRPEATFCIERAIDLAAGKLGIDRIELRRRNLIPRIAPGEPFKTGLTFTYDCGDFAGVLDKAVAAADLTGFAERRQASAASGLLRGYGMACAIEAAGGMGDEAAELRVDASGSATLLVGSHSHGQGHETMYRQILADRLGLEFSRIAFVQGDTQALGHGGGTFGSRTAAIGGSAAQRAADRVLEKMRKIAAHRLEAAEADIEFAEGRFAVAGTDRSVNWNEVAALAHAPRALPPGMETGLNCLAVFHPAAATYPNGCHVCEVEIDPETGVVRLDRYAVVDDVGTVINPLTLKGQVMGGVVQGAGQALWEAIRFDDASGQIVSGSFMDYAMPRAADVPGIVVASHPVPTAVNPLGAKGAGEAGTVGALACVHSAVLDALAPRGIAWIDMPLTSEAIWRALGAAPALRVTAPPSAPPRG